MIKAIETIYNGYRFRSRLEARWAVFLDGMGIRYEYEREGYDLKEHGWYLPDFWLPDFKMYMEIKPAKENDYDNTADYKKLEVLRDLTGFSTLMCQGYPKQLWNYIYTYDATDSSAGSYNGYATFATDYNNEPIILVKDRSEHRSMFNTSDFLDLDNILTLRDLAKRNGELQMNVEIERIHSNEFIIHDITEVDTSSCQMALKARQSRFEHEEYQG